MSFQAYLDNVEEKTGKIPFEFIAEAKEKNLTKHKEIVDLSLIHISEPTRPY